ncbi:MAG: trypsin-like peptidase domain-containing protein [Deltaproteobacteria bacterium]
MRERTRLTFALDCLTDGRDATSPRGPGTRVLRSERFLEEADRIHAEGRRWFARAGVQGLGVGPRLVAGSRTEALALRVYVDRKRPKSACAAPAPSTIEVGELGAIPVDVIELGRLRPQSFTGTARPIQPGVGVAHPDAGAGTLGCFVRRPGDDALYLLSAAHVIADGGAGLFDDAVLQPAPDDGGQRGPHTVGWLADFVPYVYSGSTFPNLVDAAIARVSPAQTARLPIRLVEVRPDRVNDDIVEDMPVFKVGRTTDRTTATVEDTQFRHQLSLKKPGHRSLAYGRPGHRRKGRVGFTQQVLCTTFTEGGDSGSLVLDSENRAVGLHVAGASGGSVFCRMSNVLRLLRVELA